MKKNLLEPLKKIIVSLGGAETTSEIKENNLVAVTEKIADTIGSDSNAIGKEVFLVTVKKEIPQQEEPGEVLQNDQGDPNDGEPGGTVIKSRGVDDPEPILVCDRTFDEIVEAINNKKVLLGYVARGTINDDAEAYSNQYGITYYNDEPFIIGFTSTFLQSGEILFFNFYLQADGAMGYMIYNLTGQLVDSYSQAAPDAPNTGTPSGAA